MASHRGVRIGRQCAVYGCVSMRFVSQSLQRKKALLVPVAVVAVVVVVFAILA